MGTKRPNKALSGVLPGFLRLDGVELALGILFDGHGPEASSSVSMTPAKIW